MPKQRDRKKEERRNRENACRNKEIERKRKGGIERMHAETKRSKERGKEE